MRLPSVIAVCGAKRSGKDAISEHFVNAYGYRNVKFAAPLKAMLGQLFGFTEAQLESESKDAIDPVWQATPRKLMQYIGTDVMQYGIQDHVPGVGRTFWAEKLFRDHQPISKLVISDLRFQHEVDVITRHMGKDFVILKVVRRQDRQDRQEHRSELEHNDIVPDVTIVNDGTIEDLHDVVDNEISSRYFL